MNSILIKTNASETIGFGHLRRCITLANALCAFGDSVGFVINDDQEAILLLKQEQFTYYIVTSQDDQNFVETKSVINKSKAVVLIVDSYNINLEAFSRLSVPCVYMDDFGLQSDYIDIILNPSIEGQPNGKGHTNYLYGPKYVLLRESFQHAEVKEINTTVRRVLITMGGGDKDNWTSKFLVWANEINPNIQFSVVIGPFFAKPVIKAIELVAKKLGNVMLHYSPKNIGLLMAEADMAISAGGQTLFEMAALGLPAIVVALVENQQLNVNLLNDKGVIASIGKITDVSLQESFVNHYNLMLSDQHCRQAMSLAGMRVVDGKGAKRVANKIYELGKVHKQQGVRCETN